MFYFKRMLVKFLHIETSKVFSKMLVLMFALSLNKPLSIII